MKKLLAIALAAFLPLLAPAQEPYPELGAKLDEYFTALTGEKADLQVSECNFLIQSCEDPAVRQYVALKVYDHYLNSKIMGDDAVAVRIAQEWFLSGKVKMNSEADLLNAKLFVEFNRSSLIGMQAPAATLFSPEGQTVRIPSKDKYSVIFFHDTSCSTCKKETSALKELISSEQFPNTDYYAIYVGDNSAEWEKYIESFPGAIHLNDPQMSGDWQRQYGVLQTPRMLLVSPSGEILGRGLDTPALKILLSREFSADDYVYGEEAQMERYDQMFKSFGDTLKSSDILDVADYLAARTTGEGNVDAFKQVEGDLLYYIASQKNEVFRDAAIPFINRYINLPEVWNGENDWAQVGSLGEMLKELTARTPVGSLIPDISVPGTRRRKPCLFVSGSKEGVFNLQKLRGNPGYIVFYTGNCSSCKETLEAVDALVNGNRKARVLLVDMDKLVEEDEPLAKLLLDTFDLSVLPFVLETDKKGIVQHRYVQL